MWNVALYLHNLITGGEGADCNIYDNLSLCILARHQYKDD